jgi:hypothetical protein
MKTAHTMMANHHGFPIRIELNESRLNLTHWQQSRARDMATFELPGFSHIKQQRLGALWIIEPGFELGRAKLAH